MYQIIVSNIIKEQATLELYEKNKKIFETKAYIGKNGITNKKQEGDGKTPLGIYKLGIAFGMHELKNKNYIQINKNLYWIDDTKSKYYNQLIDITKTEKDWETAEHLIDYKEQYEYAIEIKTNNQNIPGQGSAIFLHCSVGSPTSGCVAIDREKMRYIIENIDTEKSEIRICR